VILGLYYSWYDSYSPSLEVRTYISTWANV